MKQNNCPDPAIRDRLAVVILNWNGAELLRRFLPAVVRYSAGDSVLAGEGCQVSVVVADNGSTDGSLELLEKEFGRDVQVIPLEHNYGFTGGYNRALELLRQSDPADYYLLLNSDVEVSPGWLRPLVRTLREYPDIAAAMPKIRSLAEPEKFEYAGACGGYIDTLGYPFCRGRILQTVETDSGQYDLPRVKEIFWASGAAFLVRAEIYHTCGGLDEAFFAHMEEIDFCWRLKRQGYRVAAVPESVVRHVGGGTLPVASPRKTYLNHRNNLAMLYKNLSRGRFAAVWIVRFFLDMLLTLGYTLRGKFSLAGAILRAHRDFPGMCRRLDRQPQYGFGPVGQIYRGSIVLRYLCGRKTFGNML